MILSLVFFFALEDAGRWYERSLSLMSYAVSVGNHCNAKVQAYVTCDACDA